MKMKKIKEKNCSLSNLNMSIYLDLYLLTTIFYILQNICFALLLLNLLLGILCFLMIL